MSLEDAKRLVAYKAIDNHIITDMVVGIGSGTTIVFAIERLADRVRKESLNVTCVPTSFQAHELIIKNELNLSSLDRHPKVDIDIDGADEVDSELNLIKGGGACLLQEKIVASCSKEFVIIADYTKDSKMLGDQYKKGIPLEVIPMAYRPIQERIKKEYGGDVALRLGKAKVGPVVTDNGNFVLDWTNFDQKCDWGKINHELIATPGIVETGLFIQMADVAYIGQKDGTVRVRRRCSANK